MSTLNDATGGKTSVELALETLKPIRDLGKNWDIDISSCLEEFLHDIVGDKNVANAMLRGGEVDGDDDGEEKKEEENGDQQQPMMGFSFTEAALVLDSSSKVYSRKVEYLHQLVFKALDGLASTSTQLDGKGQKKKRSRAAPSPDIQDFLDHDPEQEFLLLDDVLPTDEAGGCRHINLPSEQLLIDQQKAAAAAGRSTSASGVELARRGAHSSAGAQSSGAAGLSMMNRTGRNSTTFQKDPNRSSIGSAALQTLIGSAGSATAGHSSLRLMRVHGCTIDASGALVMPGGRQHNYNNNSYNDVPAEQTPANDASNRMSAALSTGNDGAKNVDVGGLDDNDDGDGFAMGDDDDDDDDGGPGFAMVDNDGDPQAAVDAAAMPPPSFRKKGVTFSSDLPSHKGNQPAQVEQQEEEEEEDPWKLLDPHLPATEKKHKPRPLVVGMTLQLPPDVNELPSEAIARQGASSNSKRNNNNNKNKLKVPKLKTQKVDTWCNRDWAVDTFRANLKRAQAAASGSGQDEQSSSSVLEELEAEIDQPPIPLTGLFYGNEFEYIAKATAKRKAAEKRERLQQQRRNGMNDADGFNQQQQQAPAAEPMQDGGANDDYGDDDGGFAMGDHDDGDDNNDDDDFGGAGFQDDGGDDDNNDDGKVATNTGITVVDQAYQTSSLDDDNDSTMNDRDFAALCRARIEQFAKGAEKYASDTQLSKRVAKWQSKVKPMLENEEKRPAFDIHAYSLKILESMEQDLKQQQRDQQQGVEQDDENADENMADTQDDLRSPGDKGEVGPRLVDFAHVTQDCEQFDICRMFLASLSLCNAGNIAVRQDLVHNNSAAAASVDDDDMKNRPRSSITSTLQLELLSSKISKPMDTYLDL